MNIHFIHGYSYSCLSELFINIHNWWIFILFMIIHNFHEYPYYSWIFINSWIFMLMLLCIREYSNYSWILILFMNIQNHHHLFWNRPLHPHWVKVRHLSPIESLHTSLSFSLSLFSVCCPFLLRPCRLKSICCCLSPHNLHISPCPNIQSFAFLCSRCPIHLPCHSL